MEDKPRNYQIVGRSFSVEDGDDYVFIYGPMVDLQWVQGFRLYGSTIGAATGNSPHITIEISLFRTPPAVVTGTELDGFPLTAGVLSGPAAILPMKSSEDAFDFEIPVQFLGDTTNRWIVARLVNQTGVDIDGSIWVDVNFLPPAG